MSLRPRRSRPLRPGAAVALVGAIALLPSACSDDSDDAAPADDGSSEENDSNESPGTSGTAPTEDAVESGEPPVATFHDGTLELMVEVVAAEGDLLVVEGTLTNVSTEGFNIIGTFAEPNFTDPERIEANDLSGFVLVDWQAGLAHYPARDGAGECSCTRFEPGTESRIDAGEEVDFFVTYKVETAPSDITLVVPRFGPVDAAITG